MDDLSELDPYDLLEIPAEYRPPTLYQLLGVDDFEDDLDVITEAAKKRSAYLHQIAAGAHRKAVQELLGEVAVARRTLLKPDGKEAYDAELMSLVQDQTPEPQSSAIQLVTATGDGSNARRRQPSNSGRRKKSAWDEWKLHLASASILLLIVGVIWFMNRGGGERRAAKAQPDKQATASKKPSAKDIGSPGFAKTKKSAAKTTGSTKPDAKKSKPLPKFRGTKLPTVKGFDLNIEAPAMTKPGEEKAKPVTEPKSGSQSAAKASSKPKSSDQKGLSLADWTQGLKVDDFSKPLAERYTLKKGSALGRKNGRLVVLASKRKTTYPNLVHKKEKFSPGTAAAFTTNLQAANQSIGFSVDTLRFILAMKGEKLELRVRLQPEEKTKVACRLDNEKRGNATLIVHRPADKKDVFNWVVLLGEQTETGRFQHKISAAAPKLGMVFSAPQKASNPVTWIDNLRFGKPSSKAFAAIASQLEKF